MTDTEAAAPKKERTPEQEENRLLNRAVARALLKIEGGEGDRKAQWTEGRAKYVEEAKKLTKALKKQGVTLTVEPKTDASDPED